MVSCIPKGATYTRMLSMRSCLNFLSLGLYDRLVLGISKIAFSNFSSFFDVSRVWSIFYF